MGILLPKVSSTISGNPPKKIPPHLLDILMPKVGNHIPDLTLPNDEEEILILSSEEKAKNEIFLQEIQSQFEEKFHVKTSQDREKDVKKIQEECNEGVEEASPPKS